MNGYNWRKASRAQLCEIAYNDLEAPIQDRMAAAEELKRRAKQKHARVQYKEKAVYPR